jgi:hypothetical protein
MGLKQGQESKSDFFKKEEEQQLGAKKVYQYLLREEIKWARVILAYQLRELP